MIGSGLASGHLEMHNQGGTVRGTHQEQDLGIFVVQSQLIEDPVEPAQDKCQALLSGSGYPAHNHCGRNLEIAPVYQEHLLLHVFPTRTSGAVTAQLWQLSVDALTEK